MLPAWLIGDSEDRTFVIHLRMPRFIAEVIESFDEDGLAAQITPVEWYDVPPADEMYLARLMREAGEFYQAEAAREELSEEQE